jgi:hypothetical protein
MHLATSRPRLVDLLRSKHVGVCCGGCQCEVQQHHVVLWVPVQAPTVSRNFPNTLWSLNQFTRSRLYTFLRGELDCSGFAYSVLPFPSFLKLSGILFRPARRCKCPHLSSSLMYMPITSWTVTVYPMFIDRSARKPTLTNCEYDDLHRCGTASSQGILHRTRKFSRTMFTLYQIMQD